MLSKYSKDIIFSDIFATTDKIKEIFDIYKKNNLITNDNNENKWLFRGIETMSKCLKPSYHLIEDIYPIKKAKFEDIEINVPNNELNYLKGCDDDNYGDITDFPNYNIPMIPKIYNKQEEKEQTIILNKIQTDLKNMF
jgi:hypothetical protein